MKKELLKKVKEVIKRDELDTSCRDQQMVYRRDFIYNIMQRHGFSLTDIAKLFNRTHATVINGLRLFNDIKNDSVFLDYVDSYRIEFEPYLHYTLKPDEHNLAAQVLKCEDYWQMVNLQEKIKAGFFNKTKQKDKV